MIFKSALLAVGGSAMLRTVVLVSVALIATSGLAFAQSWEICNKTSNRVNVAIGYAVSGGHLQSQGWWVLEPNGCTNVLSRSKTDDTTTGYLYAYTSNGNPVINGNQSLCVQSNKGFTIRRHQNCEGRNFRTVQARQISIDLNKNWTTYIRAGAKPGTTKYD